MFLIFNLVISLSNNCLVFYTGGSNSMPISIYSNFISYFKDIDIYKIPYTKNSYSEEFFDNLSNKYNNINLIGHSSGCVTAINNCNKHINKIILLDPVITPYYNKKLDINYINQILIINAEKSYKWSYIPPFIPFIPFFSIKSKHINIDTTKIKTINIKDYGHCDILNNPYRDFMHYIRISIGNNNRKLILPYHKIMCNIITYFISSNNIINFNL
tara:strand:- start:78 stop:722 length:645 start_codon:yes stop_codon:yes gene_type:complete